MTNREMVKNYNNLYDLKKKEEEYRENTGEQLLRGRIRVTYAINKNMAELFEKLKPYNESRATLDAEYRDLDTEKKQYEDVLKAYQAAAKEDPGVSAPVRRVVWRAGKTPEEYRKKLDELLDIDVENVSIHMINLDALDGVQLSSTEIDVFMFMVK